MSDVHNNTELSRYEIFDAGERIGFMTYHVDGDTVTTPHTEIHSSHGSRGRGQELVKAALDDIQAQGRFVQPLCPFVQAYIERHPDYQNLVKGVLVHALLDVVLFFHLVAFGALFGGGLVQVRDTVKVINSVMLYGALSLVISGIGLVGIQEGLDQSVNSGRVAAKFGIGLVIALLCWVNRAKRGVPAGLFNAILLLTLADVAVAVAT